MKFIYSLPAIVLLACNATTKDKIPPHETLTIESKILNEKRVINIFKPDNYADGMPVIYMPDGGVKEDFPHVANTIDKLIKEKKISAVMLVGIENTERRRDLTGVTEVEKDKEIAPVVGGSENFRKFIGEELFPEIEKLFKPSSKIILGESVAGLFVMETLFLSPEMFDKYIAFDPSLWWNDHYLVRSAKVHLDKISSEKKLWFAGSSAEDISIYTKQLAEILRSENFQNLTWYYSDEPNEKHHTIFRATKEKAIIRSLNE